MENGPGKTWKMVLESPGKRTQKVLESHGKTLSVFCMHPVIMEIFACLAV